MVDRYLALPLDSYVDTVRRREEAMDLIHRQHYTAATIVSRVSREQLSSNPTHEAVYDNRVAVLRVIGMLRDQEELEVRLGPDMPRIPLGDMHPWVWGAAQQFWETTHYREAVHAAAKSINSRVQQLVDRRDVADNDLMNQALSTNDPAPGNARLRLPGDQSKGMVKGQQQALRDYAAGCFGVIRNPAVHDADDWLEQYALERLAALSVLASMIETTTVVRAAEPVVGPNSAPGGR
ncbi:TIGR02391 family protein [Blastococcus aurantiacus]|nr:TIGR02391 family protein [Blastococcus aurantiacus]